MTNQIKLEEYFKIQLKEDGFKKSKKSNTWYKKTNEGTFFVLNLQKSQWSDKYFFNVGIKYENIRRTSWNELVPVWNQTNTSSRVEMYDNNYESEIVQKLLGGIENDSDINLIETVYEYIMNFFDSNKNKDEFKKNYYEYYMLDNVAIGSPLEKYCE